jgi:hypothetical protein
MTSTATTPHASSPQPPAQAPHADHFHPEAIIDRCMDGVTLSQQRFNRLFSGEVVEFVGTVASINHDEHLVVFHGGGVYPDNWDVQLKPNGQKFSVGHAYRVVFRLTHLRDEPLAGYSFRGIVLNRTSND